MHGRVPGVGDRVWHSRHGRVRGRTHVHGEVDVDAGATHVGVVGVGGGGLARLGQVGSVCRSMRVVMRWYLSSMLRVLGVLVTRHVLGVLRGRYGRHRRHVVRVI